ncbi:MarR family winged helix-turn-helix transcriptional regulator [Actinokineospora inagensis]|uniref:MarR family winged helix-turn-helix transcriptional regulator n=1 Tax=Actinokineospora inagensis TaxID=103730 RepID=UPI0003FF7E06|nr:MarR family transcriptional regulator [Actinokineospora inagensis]
MHFLAPPPLGLLLSQTAKVIGRAMEDAMAAEGGTVPVWQVLLTLKTRPVSNQRELAAAVGIQGATLTHHLNAMEDDGLLTRRRSPGNRRVHEVELTERGEELFARLRGVAVGFDQRLRSGFSPEETATLAELLTRLKSSVDDPE